MTNSRRGSGITFRTSREDLEEVANDLEDEQPQREAEVRRHGGRVRHGVGGVADVVRGGAHGLAGLDDPADVEQRADSVQHAGRM
jgi:hypothetical protein